MTSLRPLHLDRAAAAVSRGATFVAAIITLCLVAGSAAIPSLTIWARFGGLCTLVAALMWWAADHMARFAEQHERNTTTPEVHDRSDQHDRPDQKPRHGRTAA